MRWIEPLTVPIGSPSDNIGGRRSGISRTSPKGGAGRFPPIRIVVGAALAVVILTSSSVAGAHSVRPDDPTLTRAEWVSPGRLRIRAGTGGGQSVTVKGRVNFGPFHYDWVAGNLTFASGQVRTLDLAVPSQGFLHPLASTYLGDLLVRVETKDGEGRPRQEVALDNLYVAWPQGQEGPPKLWDDGTMPAHGVLDPELQRAAARVSPNARLGPPIAHLKPGGRAVEEDTAGEDSPLSEQVPADPNDEGSR